LSGVRCRFSASVTIQLAILISVIGLLVLSPSVYADTTYWAKSYGGTDRDTAFAVEQTSDLGYILVGDTWSFGSGRSDVWILKLSASGSVEWQRTYGGAEDDEALSVHQTQDGGYIVAGYTASFGDLLYDMWVLKIDSSGNISDCLPIGSSSASVVDTHATVVDTDGTVSSISEVRTETDATIAPTSAVMNSQCFESRPSQGLAVGGFMENVNKAAVFAPYLALFGFVAAVAVIVWKKREN